MEAPRCPPEPSFCTVMPPPTHMHGYTHRFTNTTVLSEDPDPAAHTAGEEAAYLGNDERPLRRGGSSESLRPARMCDTPAPRNTIQHPKQKSSQAPRTQGGTLRSRKARERRQAEKAASWMIPTPEYSGKGRTVETVKGLVVSTSSGGGRDEQIAQRIFRVVKIIRRILERETGGDITHLSTFTEGAAPGVNEP